MAVLTIKSKKYGNVPVLVDDDLLDDLQRYIWHVIHTHNGMYVRGYLAHCRKGPRELMHRLVCGNIPDGMVVDHINHNTLDNRRENLRVCTHAQNMWNRLGVRGSHPNKNGYAAFIRVNGERKYLGTYPTAEAAAAAYNRAKKELHGPFAPSSGLRSTDVRNPQDGRYE